MKRDIYQAIADPTRRAILDLLANQRLTPNAIAAHFKISRPAISKHIKILTESGLVVAHKQGRERYYEARLDKLNEVSNWIERSRQRWEARLDALANYLEDVQRKEV